MLGRDRKQKPRRSRSEGRIRLFRTVRVSVTVALFVLLALNFVGVYLTLSRANLDRVEAVGQLAIQSVAGSFEIVLNNMRAAAVQAARSPEFAEVLASYDESVAEKLKISRLLSEFAAFHPYVRNVRIRVEATGEVFSTDQGVRTYTFANPRVHGLDAGLYQSDPVIANAPTRPRVALQIAAPVPLDSTEPRGVMVHDLDFERMTSHLLESTPGAEATTILIFNGAGQLVHPLERPPDIPNSTRSIGSYESEDLGWRFESYIPTSLLREFGGTSLSIALPLLLGSVGATLAMVVVLLIIRRPIAELGVEYQSHMLQRYLVERSVTNEEFVREVANASSGGSNLRYTVALLETGSAMASSARTSDIAKSFADAAVDPLVPYRFSVNSRTSGILIAAPTRIPQLEFERSVRVWVQSQVEVTESEDTDISLYVGIGGSTESSRDVPNCFHQATSALTHKILASDRVIQFHGHMATSHSNDVPRDTESRIAEAVCDGSAERARTLTKSHLDSILSDEACLPDDRIRSGLYRFQNTVHRLAHERAHYAVRSIHLDLENLTRSDEIVDAVQSFVRECANEICSAAERPSRVDQILAIIEASWKDPDFNLNALCDRVGLNRSYVGKLIKETTGEKFNHIVNGHRIGFAKETLRRGASVDEAAQRAGYRYPTYFIRVFKESQGCTPGQFREREADGNVN